ncbi:MAG TPA: tripartite tricarboxylate transporter substrate binding protein [Casimicrobiaceae bacterium]|nr:tripartite tricarboxylate transporter substrate binding protein [Casimicrobiaceae bacterium]
MLIVPPRATSPRTRSRRRFIRDLAVLLAGASAAPAFAQNTGDYPVRPIRFIIPNTVGGTSDILARLIGARLSDALAQPVIVESRPGAAGRIALDHMGKAAPDGYTILLGNNGTNAIVPGAQAADDSALVPVIKLASLAIVIAATPRLEVKSLVDTIERARRKPDSLAYASSGVGSTSHMAAALLSQRAGIRLLQIPYAGTASAVKDVLAGEVPLIFTHLATVATLIRAGQLRALAVTGLHRTAAFPDIPTVAESGFPGFDVATWHGVLAPPGTPREIVMRLHGELARIVAMEDMRAQLATMGMEPLSGTPEEFAADIKADRQHWATVIRDAGLPSR